MKTHNAYLFIGYDKYENMFMQNVIKLLVMFSLSFSNINAGEIISYSKKRAIKIYKRLKAEKKKPKAIVKKEKRTLYIVIDENKKKIRTFLTKETAEDFASLIPGFFVKKIRPILKKYHIIYTDNSEKEVEIEEEESHLDFEFLPFKFRGVNSNNYVHSDYDGNYMNFSKGFEMYKGKFSFKAQLQYESYDIDGEGDYDRLYPYELMLTYANKGLEVNIGPQIRVWGVFDELSELDVITLKNTSRAFFDDGVNLRRPTNLLHLQKYFGDDKLEGFINVPMYSGYFSDVKNRYFGVDVSEGRLRGGSLPAAFQAVLPLVSIKNEDRDELGFGFRYSTTLGSTDLQFIFSQMQSDVPSFVATENFLQGVRLNTLGADVLASGINIKYFSVATFGFAATKQFGDLLFKTELAYKTGVIALTESFENEELSKISTNFGGEYELNSINSTLRFQVNSQLLQNQNQLLIDDASHSLVGEFVKPFMGEKLEAKLRYAVELEESGYFLSPSLKYEISDEVSASLKIFLFDGDEESDFGYHSKDDLIDLEINIAI